jgi:dTMP kinase
VIQPALDSGETVICDRYLDSTLAYQGGGRGLDLAQLQAVQHFATGGLTPDLRLLLDLPVEVGLARRYADAESVNRIDGENLAFHQRVRASYRASALTDPAGWVVMDATRPPASIAGEIWAIVRGRLA